MFNNLEEIIQEFDIDSSDSSEILTLLKEKRIQLHPDKTGGSFKSDDCKKEYESVNQAILFLDSKLDKSNELALMTNGVRDLLEIISKQNITAESLTAENKLSETINNNIIQFKSKSLFPKISSSTITILVTYIFMFPNQIQNHPILSKFINISNQVFLLVWLMVLLTTIELWAICFIKENKNKEILAKFKTETYQNNLFMEFIEFIERNKSFSRDDLLNYIINGNIKPETQKIKNKKIYISILSKVYIFMFMYIIDLYFPHHYMFLFLSHHYMLLFLIVLFIIMTIISISRSTSETIYFNIEMDIAEELTNNILLRANKKELITKDNNCKSMSDNYKLCL